jgi:hypothetical protein
MKKQTSSRKRKLVERSEQPVAGGDDAGAAVPARAETRAVREGSVPDSRQVEDNTHVSDAAWLGIL